GGRGRQRRFQTPRSPRVFPKISRRSLRARRFKRAPRPLFPPRAPEPAPRAVGAEAARDDFKRRARRDRGAFSRTFLGVLCALGVSNRAPRPLLPPRAPEPAPGVVGPYDRLRAPPLQHARNARVGESRQSARQLL